MVNKNALFHKENIQLDVSLSSGENQTAE